MRLPETITEYKNALVDAPELGALKALEAVDRVRPYLKLKEAQRNYGEAIVNRWLKEGLITKIKDGPGNASVRIDRVQIEAVAKACNRATFMTTEEREEKPINAH